MKLCRFQQAGAVRCGLYHEHYVLPLDDLAAAEGEKVVAEAIHGGELERLLPSDSPSWRTLTDLVQESEQNPILARLAIPLTEVTLLPPIARPPKLLLLAGNYAAHVEESGDIGAERERTFPYVFMKPSSTTLIGNAHPVVLPAQSSERIDHEIELAVIIGRKARNVTASEALSFVAGYTIINDISDRGFRPNPNRQERPRDKFFDWQHGKWHDGFCPCGPCLVTADEIPDPQALQLELTIDGEVRQQSTTAEQVFSIAQVIEFLSTWMTLEPGDIISTGTPAGVGNASGKYLRAGQTMQAKISSIGILTNPIVAQ